jgi:hypothetical protein
MSLRAVALGSGVVGGLSWLALLVLDQAGSGGSGLHDALHWAGLVLLGIAMVGFGASLASSSAIWLRVIVGIAFPALVWSVLEVFHPAGDPEVVDGIFGGAVALLSVVGLARRPARHGPPPRRAHGAHAR